MYDIICSSCTVFILFSVECLLLLFQAIYDLNVGKYKEVGDTMANTNIKEASSNLDYNCVKKELLSMMDNPDHDDGSIGPILIRLAWHSSGTYDKESKSGGSCGAGMRLPESSEALDPENKGLEVARAFIE